MFIFLVIAIQYWPCLYDRISHDVR